MSQSIKTVSFTLGEHDRNFISDMVENGRFGSKTEVVRAGLRLLEDYEANQKLNRLRTLIAEGNADIESGRAQDYSTTDEVLSDILNTDRPEE